MKNLTIFLFATLSFFANSSWAVSPAPFADCSNPNQLETFYNKSELNKTKSIALKGNVEAQIKLGSYYMYGTGTCVDYVEARKWFELAAAQDNAYAISNLGSIYLDGFEDKIPKDYPKAMGYLNRCAAMDVANCYYNLGVMYRDGFGVEPNEQMAVASFLKTARNGGDIEAQSNLGLIALKNKDYEQAYKWFSSAARFSDVDSAYSLSKMYGEGLGVEVDQEKSLDWLIFAANLQNYSQTDMNREEVLFELGVKFEKGLGLKGPNDLIAYALFNMSNNEKSMVERDKLNASISPKQMDFINAFTQSL